jgi:hypothetical protein
VNARDRRILRDILDRAPLSDADRAEVARIFAPPDIPWPFDNIPPAYGRAREEWPLQHLNADYGRTD